MAVRPPEVGRGPLLCGGVGVGAGSVGGGKGGVGVGELGAGPDLRGGGSMNGQATLAGRPILIVPVQHFKIEALSKPVCTSPLEA